MNNKRKILKRRTQQCNKYSSIYNQLVLENDVNTLILHHLGKILTSRLRFASIAYSFSNSIIINYNNIDYMINIVSIENFLSKRFDVLTNINNSTALKLINVHQLVTINNKLVYNLNLKKRCKPNRPIPQKNKIQNQINNAANILIDVLKSNHNVNILNQAKVNTITSTTNSLKDFHNYGFTLRRSVTAAFINKFSNDLQILLTTYFND